MKNCTILRIPVLLLLFSLLLSSCVDKEKQLEEKLFGEVMQIHDEVMPEMSVLMRLIKKMNAQSDSLVLVEKIDTLTVSKLKESSAILKSANDAMMDWMHQFSKPSKDIPHEKVIEFYNAQKASITNVKEQMLSAKKVGEELL